MKTATLLKTKKDKIEFLTWIATLQSGVLQKGKNSLEETPGKYCCLGVGCAVTIPSSKLIFDDDSPELIAGAWPSSQPAAPEWLKIVNSNFEARTGTTLSTLNDQGTSHPEIAKKLLAVYKDEL